MPIGSGISSQLLLTGSPDPRQLPFGPGNRPYPTSYAATIRRRGRYTGSRFPVAFRRVGVGFLGLSAPRWELRLPHARPTGHHHAGPQRGCHVAHEQDSTGQGAPFTPGTVVRSRPTTILRPAPAASQRPVPTAPLTHPIGGGHLHEASSGVHSRSPITPRRPDAAPEPERNRFPPVFSSPAAPGWNGSRFGFYPGLRTPRSPAEHAGAETGPSRTDPGTTPMASAKPPNGASHFTHAPSCRT